LLADVEFLAVEAFRDAFPRVVLENFIVEVFNEFVESGLVELEF